MFTATDTPIFIATNGVNYTSTINVAQDFPITDVNVIINITHEWIRDITASIISPNGTIVELTSVNGGNGPGSYDNTVFDQEATSPITGGVSPFTGNFVPEGDLSNIYGEMSAGNWVLTVLDNFADDTGTINGFTLELCVQGSLGVEENEISEFLIFPNPNHGEFTIKLNSSSTYNIKVEVFDIRGRSVFNNSYINTQNFNQLVNLNGVQSGMYFVKVSDGEKQTTKKIIVK
jgi:subtilisin-like proprotein convertase family protein